MSQPVSARACHSGWGRRTEPRRTAAPLSHDGPTSLIREALNPGRTTSSGTSASEIPSIFNRHALVECLLHRPAERQCPVERGSKLYRSGH